ncbi:MAG: patatin family protein [Lachnospiraceae bacterium]|nr:patatin family protein [Lachnospiraceae bacterium]
MKTDAGLVLEGGATRGVFTAGVLDYLMEKECYLPYVVGVSAGACNAVDYVSRQKGRTRDCMIVKEKEYDYFKLKSVVRNKSLFDMDMIFDRYPNEIFPFDFDTYAGSAIRTELVVTNCDTGLAEYLNDKEDKERMMRICRASSSVPLASPIVNIDGQPYLDGGLADSIPLIRSLRTGHKKNVVILTRNMGYRKSAPKKSKSLFVAAYSKYPNLVRTICHRHVMYNKILSYIEKWEEEGKIFVVRPMIRPVSRMEHNPDTLTRFYDHGYEQMEKQYDSMMEYLEK